jgi:hypothetical protein
MGARVFAAITGAAALLYAQTVNANYFWTGNDLYRYCTSGDTEYSVCIGYVEGVIDEWESDRATSRLQPCVPSGVVADQLKDVVVQYLSQHPADRNTLASGLVMVAAAQAWNCALY